jgi:hypothetical protein
MNEDELLVKTFPFFVVWHDNGDGKPCNGICHARSMDEAAVLAETRVVHGGLESAATVYSGDSKGMASSVRRYRWEGLKVVYEQLRKL